jgi:hypothetical protein
LLGVILPVTGFGAGVVSLSDADDDTVTVELVGPGNLVVTPVATPGAIDGKIDIGVVSGAGALKEIDAPAARLNGAGVALGGGLGEIVVGDIAAGVAIVSEVNPKLRKLKVTAAQVGAGFVSMLRDRPSLSPRRTGTRCPTSPEKQKERRDTIELANKLQKVTDKLDKLKARSDFMRKNGFHQK